MKRSAALLLQAATVLIGLAVLAFMLWEPHLEGRNAQATTFEIYFKDPFLAYVYAGSIPFFVALHRAFRLFGHAGQTGTFSQVTVDALRVIRHCAIAIIGFALGGVVFIIMLGDKEDRPAGVFMVFLVILASGVTALAATMFARHVRATLRPSDSTGAEPEI